MAGLAKGSTKQEYTPQLIAEVLHLYKIGEKTAVQLSEEYKIPERTIRNWVQKLEISKGELIEKAEEKLTNKYIKAFVARGYDEAKIAQIVGDFLESEKRDPENPKKRVPDLYNRNIGLTQFAKFTGLDKPQEETKSDKKIEIKILIATPNPSGIVGPEISCNEINI